MQPIEELCEGSAFCNCHPIIEKQRVAEGCEGSPYCSCKKSRAVGRSLLSQYKQGLKTPETRAANAAYMREYRRKKEALSWSN